MWENIWRCTWSFYDIRQEYLVRLDTSLSKDFIY